MSPALSSRLIPALVLLAGSASSHGQVTYTAGDILVGFQASGGTGAGSNYVLNLGQGTAFRDAAASMAVATIGTDLANSYGTDWFTRTDLLWAVAGVRTNASFGPDATAVVNGDPARTLYISKGATGAGSSTPHNTLASANVTTGATRMMDAQSGFRTTNGTLPRDPTPTSGGRGVLQGTGDINSWSSRVDNTPFTVFTATVKHAFGGTGMLSHLDLYRILGRNDLAGTVEPAPVGVNAYQGTFTIDGTGNIRFEPPATATGYDAWADSFGLTGPARAIDIDAEGDGLDNGVEFVVGGDPTQSGDAAKHPILTPGPGFIEFSFRRTDASVALNPHAEFDADLAGPWTPAVNGTGGVTIVEETDAFGAGVDRVTVRIPAGGPLQFVRLAVSE